MLLSMSILCPYSKIIKCLLTFKYANTNAMCLCLNVTGVCYLSLFIVYLSYQLSLTVLQLEEKQRICTNCLYVIQHQDRNLNISGTTDMEFPVYFYFPNRLYIIGYSQTQMIFSV